MTALWRRAGGTRTFFTNASSCRWLYCTCKPPKISHTDSAVLQYRAGCIWRPQGPQRRGADKNTCVIRCQTWNRLRMRKELNAESS
jgi:hypothetical protein